MPIYDFICPKCTKTFERILPSNCLTAECECGDSAVRQMPAPKIFTTIIPTTMTSKKNKAGYQHSHGDRPKTPGKIQVGYTGPSKA